MSSYMEFYFLQKMSETDFYTFKEVCHSMQDAISSYMEFYILLDIVWSRFKCICIGLSSYVEVAPGSTLH